MEYDSSHCSKSDFFGLNCFKISCNISFKKRLFFDPSFSFFSCLIFENCFLFFLLAFVSECNCFLRSRCSMEMWCLDDTRRDSWDWVGPPALGESVIQLPRVEWGLLAC